MKETLTEQLIRIIHQVSPYENFDIDNYKLDLREKSYIETLNLAPIDENKLEVFKPTPLRFFRSDNRYLYVLLVIK